jgi:hypothetical protein
VEAVFLQQFDEDIFAVKASFAPSTNLGFVYFPDRF